MGDTQTLSTTDRIVSYISDQVRMHGLSFVLLACAVWYFHGENKQMGAEIRTCNQTIIDMYRSDRIQLQEIINNNTKVLENNTRALLSFNR